MKTSLTRSALLLSAGAAIALVAAQVVPDSSRETTLSDSIKLDDSPPVRTGPLGGFADVVALASPSVVSITSTAYVPVSRDPRTGDIVAREVPGGLGSGVIVSADGYILTNVHVIRQGERVMDRVFVQLSDGREMEAQVIGIDPESDIAVLDIDAPDLPFATLGDSDQLQPGDTVLAIGSPFGLSETVTSGIVSAVGRTDLNISADEEFIQTDASINPGNSGGALVDNRGRVVGINTAIFSRSGGNVGIGFAIPITKALNIAEQLVDSGHVSRGFLGILPEEMTPELSRAAAREGLDLPSSGILVWQVDPNAPAARGGLHRHDVITAIEGQPVLDKRSFLRRISKLEPGRKTTLSVYRNGEELQLTVTLGARPTPALR